MLKWEKWFIIIFYTRAIKGWKKDKLVLKLNWWEIKNNFNAIETKEIKPKQGIFMMGKFMMPCFINNLLKNAKSEVVLIDNYIDDTIFYTF